ncbi:accessory factor UbiK family protein [Candidatus Puniceispirillum sp.]|uniref:accessory factor UbiK family protein n=1 Tax=Candidatus Puniceispirillum sp. TaxID=2026719 RepID=UPI001EB62A61|nr:accessory factor UbiK family protein [Candidatus Puniceispirillum sp.]
MAMRSSLMSDLAQMANGAASALGGVREEIDNMIRHRLERTLNARGLVTREEFDALRTRHEALAARLAMLEAAASGQPVAKSAAKSTAKSKTEAGTESNAESMPRSASKTAKRPAAKKQAAKKSATPKNN